VGCRLACGLLRCVRWCAHRQQTTAVGRGGGLHTYHRDAIHRDGLHSTGAVSRTTITLNSFECKRIGNSLSGLHTTAVCLSRTRPLLALLQSQQMKEMVGERVNFSSLRAS
jgi:hypothetical protein